MSEPNQPENVQTENSIFDSLINSLVYGSIVIVFISSCILCIRFKLKKAPSNNFNGDKQTTNHNTHEAILLDTLQDECQPSTSADTRFISPALNRALPEIPFPEETLPKSLSDASVIDNDTSTIYTSNSETYAVPMSVNSRLLTLNGLNGSSFVQPLIQPPPPLPSQSPPPLSDSSQGISYNIISVREPLSRVRGVEHQYMEVDDGQSSTFYEEIAGSTDSSVTYTRPIDLIALSVIPQRPQTPPSPPSVESLLSVAERSRSTSPRLVSSLSIDNRLPTPSSPPIDLDALYAKVNKNPPAPALVPVYAQINGRRRRYKSDERVYEVISNKKSPQENDESDDNGATSL